MDVENLSKPELLMLFSVLEGELEARDLVIEALRVSHPTAFLGNLGGTHQSNQKAITGIVAISPLLTHKQCFPRWPTSSFSTWRIS